MHEETGTDSVVGMLKEDHRKVESLFKEFEGASDRRTKSTIAQTVLQELEVHAALEEKIIYPAFRAELNEEDLMDEALEEHHVVHLLIRELKRMRSSDERYDAKLKILAEIVKHHVQEEESEMLPKAESSTADTPELAERVLARKTQLMERPSRRQPVRARRSNTRAGRRVQSHRRRAA